MRLAFLGDIHGNRFALEAVLQAALAVGVKRLLVTGDLVGYYFSPLQVLELLSSWEHDVVRGNHEEMLAKARSDERHLLALDKRYGSGIRMALEQLSRAQVDWLCSLPHPVEIDVDCHRILLCHGSPWDLNHYIYSNTPLEGFVERLPQQTKIVVMGHTHYPMIKRLGDIILVNPGSVGQPRDQKGGACWVLFDSEDGSIIFRREHYDSSNLVRECQERHPELPYLFEVLQKT